MACLEQFVPRGRARMHPLQWQLKSYWAASVDDLVMPVPSLENSSCASDGGCRRRGEAPKSLFKFRLFLQLFFCTPVCLRLAEECISMIWLHWRCGHHRKRNVITMKAVQLVVNIPSLLDFMNRDRDEMLLCLIRAIRKYLSRTEPLLPCLC